MTLRELIVRAMKQAGILTFNEEPTAEQINDAVDDLNSMLDSWSNDEMLIAARAWETFTLSAGTQQYTIGTGQTFNTIRPMLIVSSYIKVGSLNYNVEIIDDENFNAIGQPTLRGIPYYLNYDNGFPVGILRFYYTPDQNYQVFLLTEKPLTGYALDDDIILPPGWESALIFNLGVWLSPQYSQPIPESLAAMAAQTKGAIRTAIIRNRTMDWEPSVGVIPNIYNGYYSGNA